METSVTAEESLDEFPEQAFPCAEEKQLDYHRCVEHGQRQMRDKTVVICGLCRDVRHYLPRTAARIERLGQMFADYRVVLFENDSSDASGEFLDDWQTVNPRVDVIRQSFQTPRFAQSRSLRRAAAMAHYRNQYHQRVVQRYSDFDFVVVVDTDLPGGWSYQGIAHSFGNQPWDFVGSYGIRRRKERPLSDFPYTHCDVWAFRPAPGTEARKLVDHTQLRFHRGDSLVPVESCFGGLGIYTMECFRSAEYAGGDCEHVVFHDRLSKVGFDRLWINPNQIVLYSPV